MAVFGPSSCMHNTHGVLCMSARVQGMRTGHLSKLKFATLQNQASS
jgi:hypothetical protein